MNIEKEWKQFVNMICIKCEEEIYVKQKKVKHIAENSNDMNVIVEAVRNYGDLGTVADNLDIYRDHALHNYNRIPDLIYFIGEHFDDEES